MDTNNSGNPRNDDFLKKMMRYMKYSNLNSEINSVQMNRFRQLFSKENDKYMFLLLRIMNAYSMCVQTYDQQYYTNDQFRNWVLNYIFNPSNQFFQNGIQIPYSNDIDVSLEVGDEDDTNLIDNDENSINENETTLPYDNSLLKQFFDIHFGRMGDYIYFKSFYSFVSYDPVNNIANTFLPQDNYVEYLNFLKNGGNTAYTYSGKDIKFTLIDENFKKFIDDVFISIDQNRYWSSQRRIIFHNYLRNWGIIKIFQKKTYPKCTMHFNKVFYEWNMCGENNTPQLKKLDHLQLALEITHFMSQSQHTFELNIGSDKNNCLDFGLFPLKRKSQKHNCALIKKYICYFTMNNADVLDNLALDYVNSLLLQTFSRKNTVFCGDYDKYYKWINLFSPAAIRSTGLIEFYPYLIPIQTVSLLNNRDEDIEKAIKDNAKEINIVRS